MNAHYHATMTTYVAFVEMPKGFVVVGVFDSRDGALSALAALPDNGHTYILARDLNTEYREEVREQAVLGRIGH